MDLEAILLVVVLIAVVAYVFGKRERRPSLDFTAIYDRHTSINQVQQALREAGLESCNLVVAVDFTKSNEAQGARTFQGKSLHALERAFENPYQQAIRVIASTLQSFDEDDLIPAFGFGDITTKGNACFPFFPSRPCHTLEEVLSRYTELASTVKLSGPTNFAPVIYAAIELVKQVRDFHVLIIVADGQVTSPAETIQAIVDASNYALSIVMIGVGDGPWQDMHHFDDELPERKFDNFQFVEFHKVMASARDPEPAFALAALMEVPEQYKSIKRLGYI